MVLVVVPMFYVSQGSQITTVSITCMLRLCACYFHVAITWNNSQHPFIARLSMALMMIVIITSASIAREQEENFPKSKWG